MYMWIDSKYFFSVFGIMSFFDAREKVVWNAPLVGIAIVSSLLFEGSDG